MKNWLKENNSIFVLRALEISLVLFLFGFPLLAKISLLLLAVAWIGRASPVRSLHEILGNSYFWLFAAYLLLTLGATAYSTDKHQAFFYVDNRLMLIYMPFVLVGARLTRRQLNEFCMVTILTCLSVMAAGLVNSLILYLQTQDTGFFYNDNLLLLTGKHAPFFAIYLNVGLVMTGYLYFGQKKIKFWLFLTLTGLLLIFLLLLAVRMALLTMCLLVICRVIYLLRTGSIRTGGIILLVFMLGSAMAFFSLPQLQNRFDSMFSTFNYRFDNPNPINHFNGEIRAENWNGLTVRLALWNCGWEIIREHPVSGVGTGDYDTHLKEQFERKHFVYAQQMHFGVHNQYLYSWISFGLFGLVLLILMLVLPLRKALQRREWLYAGFVLVMGLAMLTDDVLNRFDGEYFYAVMNSMLFFTLFQSKER